jgi:transposase InsO family protein
LSSAADNHSLVPGYAWHSNNRSLLKSKADTLIPQPYQITGNGTVHKWIRKTGRNHRLPKVIRVKRVGEAERLSGILKSEFGLGGTFANLTTVVRVLNEAVLLYNFCRPHRRPHTALGYPVPMEVYTSTQTINAH